MLHIKRILLAAVLAALCVHSPAAEPAASPRWLPASPEKLPRWRGFNLLEKFYLQQRPQAVPGGRFPPDLEARLQFRAAADGLSSLDQGRQLGAVRRGDARRNRPGRRLGREVRHPRGDQFPSRPRLHGGHSAGADQPLDRCGNAARLRQALGHVRPPLPRHPQHAAQLQSHERAGHGRRRRSMPRWSASWSRPSAAKTRNG